MTANESGIKTWGLLAAVTAFGGYFLISSSRLARFSKEFQLRTSVRIHEVSLVGLTLAVDIVFLNPTDARLTLKHPTVYIYNADPKTGAIPVVASTVENFQYQIQPNAETPLKPVYISMTFLDSEFLGAQHDRYPLRRLWRRGYGRTPAGADAEKECRLQRHFRP